MFKVRSAVLEDRPQPLAVPERDRADLLVERARTRAVEGEPDDVVARDWQLGYQAGAEHGLLIFGQPGITVWQRPGHFSFGDVAEPEPGLDKMGLAVAQHRCEQAAELLCSVVSCAHQLPEQVTTKRLRLIARG